MKSFMRPAGGDCNISAYPDDEEAEQLTNAGGVVGMECAFALYPVDHVLLRNAVEPDENIVLWMLEQAETFLEVFVGSLVAYDVETERT